MSLTSTTIRMPNRTQQTHKEASTLHKELQVTNNAESGRNNSFPGKKNKLPNEASQTEQVLCRNLYEYTCIHVTTIYEKRGYGF